MTRFWKEGFYRTNSYGNPFWVEGHWVDRNNWDRDNLSSYYTYYLGQLHEYRVNFSATAQFVNPNANCPVCYKPVFFYQNIHGSRVFFDELGPPWPRHPCTDNLDIDIAKISKTDVYEPFLRNDSEISYISTFINESGIDLNSKFEAKYYQKHWATTQIIDRFKTKSGFFIILMRSEPESKNIFLFHKTFPRYLKPGSFVFYNKGKLSFLNKATLKPTDLSVRCFRNASQFINELVIARNNQVL